MGHQIHAGDESILFSDGAWLVVNWVERFAPAVKPNGLSQEEWLEQSIGSTDISAEQTRIAHEAVPMDFKTARNMGLLQGHYRRPIDESTFDTCRNFLRNAAEGGHLISGSY